MSEHADVPPRIIAEVRSICLGLPEVAEEDAWVGTRWRIRKRTFAHVLTIDAGWPPAYARAVGDEGPLCVMTFRSQGEELGALRSMGRPFFAPRWRGDEVGIVLDERSDWAEVAELLTESYCVQAPKKLAARVGRPAGPGARG